MMRKYDVDYKRWGILLLPTVLRKPILSAFVKSLMHGCSVLHSTFKSWMDTENYKLSHNSQVCYMRGLLNDTFDAEQRRITLSDIDESTLESSSVVIYMRSENKTRRLSMRILGKPWIITTGSLYGANMKDFYVHLPLELKGKIDEDRLDGLVAAYRLAGKRWIINYR